MRANTFLTQLAEVKRVWPLVDQSLPTVELAGGFMPRQLAIRQSKLAAANMIGAVVLHASHYRHNCLISIHEVT